LVACAVSATCEQVGVDVESVERKTDALEIAKRCFAASEFKRLRAVTEQQRRERFFCYWTLKESYAKARGLGLSLPLEQLSFELDGGPRIGVSFEPELRDDPTRWSFALVRPSALHRLAVAAGIGAQVGLRLRYARCIPLRGVLAQEQR
jgi:4'-phosphopantetheinyl transferase